MTKQRLYLTLISLLLVAVVASGCNLVAESAMTPTVDLTTTAQATPGTTTPTPTLFIPTLSGQLPTASFPTSAALPTAVLPPTAQPVPIRIVIVSPTPGSILAGTVSVFGSAVAPNFLQYQLEYGPEPNTANLWYQADSVRFAPVQNGLLGSWTTSSLPDGTYTLRLRVFLRDGTILTSSVGGLQVRNARPTPPPTATSTTPRPIAAYSQSVTSGTAPLTVNFLNQSTGFISSYQWNFGDGTSSTAVSPVKTYFTPGLYNVVLTVTGPGGTSNVSSQVIVSGPQAPKASFTANPLSGDAPLAVQFTDTSSGVVSSYFWNFGDGTATTERNPRHTFNSVGTYNVFLTVTGPGGTSVAVQQVIVRSPQVQPPVAAFTFAPSSGQAPLSVQFTNSSSGNISSYSWNFGDGTVSNATNPVKVYQFAGTYTVTLLVFGPGGQAAATGTVTVSAPPTATPTSTFTPTATFTPTQTPTSTLTPTNTTTPVTPTHTPTFTPTFTETPTTTPTNTLTPTFTTTAVPPTFTETPTNTALPPEPTATPTFTETPTNTTTAVPPTATPTFTETPTATQVPPPVAGFSAIVLPDNPLMVQFTNLSTGEGLSGFTWDFGDGQTSNELNPVHTYATTGSYTVTLTAAGAGGSNSFSQIVSVTAPPTATATTEPVQAAFSFTVDGFNPLAVQFTNASSGPVASFAWDFGDGAGFSADANPFYTYGAGGSYTVTLTVTSTDGSTNATQQVVTVTAPPTATATTEPVQAAFSFTVDGFNPLAVQFTNASSGPVASFAWDFGDGAGFSADANPFYTYSAGGAYVVTLTVTSTDGSTSAAQQTVTVTAPATPTSEPVSADFTFVTAPDNPLSVQFTSLSTGPVSTFSWNFGDGVGTSSEQNPIYTYGSGGTYPVTLTVSAADGVTTDSTTLDVTVEAVSTIQPAGVQPLFTLQGPPSGVYTIAFNPGFNLLAAGNGDGTVTIWDMGSESPIQTLTNHTDSVASVAWSPDGSRLASASLDGTVVIVDANTWTPIITLPLANKASAVAFSPNGAMLATGAFDGSVQFWDSNGAPLNSYSAADEVYWLAWRPDGSQLAYTGAEGAAVILDVATATPVVTIPLGNGNPIGATVAWNPSGSQLLVGTTNQGAAVYDSASGSLVISIPDSNQHAVFSAAWSAASNRIALGTDSADTLLVDAATGMLLSTLPATGEVTSVAWNLNNGQLATANDDGAIQVWLP